MHPLLKIIPQIHKGSEPYVNRQAVHKPESV